MRSLRVLQHLSFGYVLSGPSQELRMPPRFAPALFGLVLSGMMSFVVSGIATIRNAGLVDGVLSLWLGAWLLSWLIAFPVVLIVAPVARRLVSLMIKAPTARLG